MRNLYYPALICASFIAQACSAATPPASESAEPLEFKGMCEASAAVDVADGFVVVADDDDDVLRTYSAAGGNALAITAEIPAFLKLPPDKASKDPEHADLEGGAIAQDRIYWTSSHSLSKSGKERPERFVLFATSIDRTASPPALAPLGTPYRKLRDDLVQAPGLGNWRLAEAAALTPEMGLTKAEYKVLKETGAPPPPATPDDARRRAEGGLNIEGLAAAASGGVLLGFRSPVRNGNALIVRLTNPDKVITASERGRIVDPVALDLGGRGIRSLDRIGQTDEYLITAGPVGASPPTFRLFRWREGATSVVELSYDVGALFPEAAVVAKDGTKALLLSDDGDFPTEGECPKRKPSDQKFRAIEVSLTK